MNQSQNHTPPDNTFGEAATPTRGQGSSAQNNNDTSESSTATDTTHESVSIDHAALMGILCYLGPLVLVPYFTSKENAFVRYHIKQGLVLLGLMVASYILGLLVTTLFLMMAFVWPLLMLLNLALIVLMVIGIINVVQKVEKPLPIVGHLVKHINI